MSAALLPLAPGQTPRQWQIDATHAARAAFKQGFRSGLISAATGTGKGTLLASWCRMSAASGRRVLVLVHREELIQDLYLRIMGIPGRHTVGICQGPRNELAAQIVVASVQSLRTRLQDLGRTDFVITDEAHHATAPTYQAIYERLGELRGGQVPLHLGTTATPFRSAEGGGTSGLGSVFEAVFYEYTIGKAIDAGDLVPVRGLRVETEVDLTSCRVGSGGDYVEEDLTRLVDTDARNALVVDYYEQHGELRAGLVFAASIEHAQHLAQVFQARGHDFRACWGVMPRQDRKQVIGDFLAGRCQGLVSRDLLFEGFDAPRASILLKARPTKSKVIFIQLVGRGLRLYPGKTECLFVDFIDNGCDLDLQSIPDLSGTRDDDEARQARPLIAGDEVERRHHRDWGIGQVAAVLDGEIYQIRWPVSVPHPDGKTLRHTRIDLCRARVAGEMDEDGNAPPDRPQPTLVTVHDYEIMLLPGRAQKTALGWYEYQGCWTAGGRIPGQQGTGGWRDQDGQATALVRKLGSGGWSTWMVERAPGARAATVRHLSQRPEREAAMREGEAELKRLGARWARVDAEWKGQSASEKQVQALRRWKIRRDLTEISKGEASALLDAVVARRLVGEELRRATGVAVAR